MKTFFANTGILLVYVVVFALNIALIGMGIKLAISVANSVLSIFS